MAEIPLTNGGVAVVDDADYEALAQFRWQRSAQGYAHRYRRQRPAKGVSILMHRVVLDAPSDRDVDHINHDGLDNRRGNLRLCTPSQNLANRARQKNNTVSIYKGVSFDVRWPKKPWYARCCRKWLGRFLTQEEAAQAYNDAAVRQYGEFAYLNVIQANR